MEVHHPYIVKRVGGFRGKQYGLYCHGVYFRLLAKILLEKNGILPEATVLKYVRQIGEALQFVHDKSILHLDIKPSNI
ncbi:hypothetical protein KMW35_24250 [Parabacteroides distasonis]|nr:hypothetical protein [Parabacteroides distasonis]